MFRTVSVNPRHPPARAAPTNSPILPAPPTFGDLSILFQKTPTALLVVDADTLNVVAANEAATRALGFAQAELVGRALKEFLVPSDLGRLPKLLDESPAVTRVLEARSAWELRRRDGTSLRMEVASDLLPLSGHPCVILFQPPKSEVTPRAMAQSGFDPTEFTFAALHDLKEPLNLIKGYLSLLRERDRANLSEESREFLEYALGGAKQMQATVVNLLEYFRADVKGVAPEPVSFEAVLAETLEGLRLQIAESGATITHDALPRILADRVQIGRVLQNLLSNAIKFRTGGPGRVHVGAADRGTDWEFTVRDNGIGIAPADHERVFRPFQRLHSSDRFPGTGLGLSICKKIVEFHGGRIWIVSELGKGTEIHFALPKGRT